MRFPMSLRRSSYVAYKPPKGVPKTQNGRFLSKIALRLKKVCYKVFLSENCQRQSCKAFIGLTNRAKMIVKQPLLPEILDQTDPKPPKGAQKRSVQNLKNKLRKLRNGTRWDVSYY